MTCTSILGKRDHSCTQTLKSPTFVFEEIPKELILHIFSYLKPKEIQGAISVSKSWNLVTLLSVQLEVERTYNSYIHFFSEAIDNPELINDLSLDFSKNVNLLKLRSLLLNNQKKLIFIIKSLAKQELLSIKNQLRNISIPPLFEDTIPLAFFHKELEATKLKANLNKRDQNYEVIAGYFSDRKYFQEAIEVSDSITQEHIADSALSYIIDGLIELNRWDQAIEVAERMKIMENIDSILTEINDALLKKLEKLKLLTTSMHKDKMMLSRDGNLFFLILQDCEVQEFRNVYTYANSIEDEKLQKKAYSIISNYLCIYGKFKDAIQVARNIENKCIKSSTFLFIFTELCETKRISEAFELLPFITEIKDRYIAEHTANRLNKIYQFT